MTNYPRWKYILLAVLLLVGFIYALPNVYGEDPAVQITGLKHQTANTETQIQVKNSLETANLPYKSIEAEEPNVLLVRFLDTETQLKAKEEIAKSLGEDYSVALNLAPLTPKWLEMIGAKPMKLGLDLRGGVHFLMEVDIDSVIQRRLEGYYSEVPKILREDKIRYKKVEKTPDQKIKIVFDSEKEIDQAKEAMQKRFPEFILSQEDIDDRYAILADLSPATIKELRNEVIEQTMSTLRNRVNELGVAEAIVQRHGLNQIIVELPGIQDTAYAKNILGKTATLKFLMMDHEHDVQEVLSGHPVAGSKIYFFENGQPILLKNRLILTGDSITGASTGQDRDGRPAVNIRLGGDTSVFAKATRDNIGKRMATVYVEIKDHKTTETVINAATIQSALGNNFQITGVGIQEARDLALLLRSGALPAPISIVEERIVGPSMGQDNIRMGKISVAVGLGLVLIFMAAYYSVFGLIADLALMVNLILLLAVMSLMGATLTLPGIAGIVLTLGMAVDASVLIFERIREEMRLGLSPQSSIHRGFDYAFATILDSNLTTLIVVVILFAVGTGPVKGFAVTISIGILTSLLTGTMGSRALVNLFFGKRTLKRLPIGV